MNGMQRNELDDCGMMIRDRNAAVENEKVCQSCTVNLISH